MGVPKADAAHEACILRGYQLATKLTQIRLVLRQHHLGLAYLLCKEVWGMHGMPM